MNRPQFAPGMQATLESTGGAITVARYRAVQGYIKVARWQLEFGFVNSPNSPLDVPLVRSSTPTNLGGKSLSRTIATALGGFAIVSAAWVALFNGRPLASVTCVTLESAP
jgi:hypothetical protein